MMSNSEPKNDDAARARLAAAQAADAVTHSDHDGHDAVAAEEPEEAPRQVPRALYIAPLIIFLLVLLFIWRPVTDAFARFQGQSGTQQFSETTTSTGEVTAVATGTVEPVTPALAATAAVIITVQSGGSGTVIPQPTDLFTAVPTNIVAQPTLTNEPPTTAPVAPTDTAVPPTDTAVPPTDTAVPPTATVAPAPSATTSGGLPSNYGDTANGALRSIAIDGATFRVEASALVPDWVFSNENGVASWVDGTVINYLVGLPQSDTNQALFDALKPGDRAALTLAGGDVYTFVIDKTSRVNKNDTSVLAQDHPALTMLLLGAPGDDRAVAQGHFVE